MPSELPRHSPYAWTQKVQFAFQRQRELLYYPAVADSRLFTDYTESAISNLRIPHHGC